MMMLVRGLLIIQIVTTAIHAGDARRAVARYHWPWLMWRFLLVALTPCYFSPIRCSALSSHQGMPSWQGFSRSAPRYGGARRMRAAAVGIALAFCAPLAWRTPAPWHSSAMSSSLSGPDSSLSLGDIRVTVTVTGVSRCQWSWRLLLSRGRVVAVIGKLFCESVVLSLKHWQLQLKQ
jgi:hypothetical protein